MKTQKKGFTLIELMVVIVIIGVLAAIAIPKLFGMSAKAKAQEVPGAAGTWSKLQAAYLVETGYIGDNTQINYKHPGQGTYSECGDESSSFNYCSKAIKTESVAIAEEGATWTAVPKFALNDQCGVTPDAWKVTFFGGNTVDAGVVAGCDKLTPSFAKLK